MSFHRVASSENISDGISREGLTCVNFQADYTDYHEEFAQLRCCANSSLEGKGWLRGVLRVASSFGPPVKPFFVCLCSIKQLESATSQARDFSSPPPGREEWTKRVSPCSCTQA